MKLLDARVNGMPRQVNTKYGEKSVLDVVTSEGEYTVWRPANDREVLGRRNGERVTISLDSKGKVSLVEHCSSTPQLAAAKEETIETPQTTRSADIADYIQRCGKLYRHCLETAANIPTSIELEPHSIKDIGTTIFIQTVRHFDL